MDRTITYDYAEPPVLIELSIDLTKGDGVAADTLSIASGSLTSENEMVGVNGVGRITQSGGANNAAGNMRVGQFAGSAGDYSLSNGSLTTGNDEIVGGLGNGTFTQTGGTNTMGGLDLGLANNGIGAYTLNGTNAALSANGETVGGDGRTGGNGTFTQLAGTNTVALELNVGFRANSTGLFTLSGGTLVVTDGTVQGTAYPGSAYIGLSAGSVGRFEQSGGTNNCPTFYLGSQGT